MALVCEWQSLGGVVLHSVLLRSAPKAGTRRTAFLDRMLPAKRNTKVICRSLLAKSQLKHQGLTHATSVASTIQSSYQPASSTTSAIYGPTFNNQELSERAKKR